MSEATWYVSTFHQINSSSFDKETAQFSPPFHTHPQTNTSDGSSTYSPNDCFDLLRVPGCCVVLQKDFSFFCSEIHKILQNWKINCKSVKNLQKCVHFMKSLSFFWLKLSQNWDFHTQTWCWSSEFEYLTHH